MDIISYVIIRHGLKIRPTERSKSFRLWEILIDLESGLANIFTRKKTRDFLTVLLVLINFIWCNASKGNS